MQNPLFFALEVQAPWQPIPDDGRIIAKNHRHITLAFLGPVDFKRLQPHLPSLPEAPFRIAPTGIFTDILFLPDRHPNVASFAAKFFDDAVELWQKTLADTLTMLGIPPHHHKGPFLPHVTLSRAPKHLAAWKETFQKLPFFTPSFHLYESLGQSTYNPLWTKHFLPPFEEFEHTADVAFIIRGQSFNELYQNGALALAFSFPPLVAFMEKKSLFSLDEVIMELNLLLTTADIAIGAPFKAVSFHGEAKEESGILTWEMIVDV